MTIEQQMTFAQGATYWQQYVNLNGYAFAPTSDGLRRLSNAVGVRVATLRRAINFFLES